MNKLGKVAVALAMAFSVGAAFGAETPAKFLSYVESPGTLYVNTGYKPSAKTRIEARYQLTSTGNEKNYVFGEYGSSSSGRCQFSHGAVGLFGFGAKYDDKTYSLADDTDWHTVVMDKGAFSVDGEACWTGSSSGTPKELYLFGNNGNGTAGDFSTIRIASVLISEDGVPKRIFAPCQMGDGTVGLWDFAAGKFYGPSGEGALTAGSEAAQTVTRLDYIRFVNGAYIDVGVVPSAHGFEMRFRDEKESCSAIVGISQSANIYKFWSSGTDFCRYLYNGTATGGNVFTEQAWCAKDHHVIFNRASDHGFVVDGINLSKTIGTTVPTGTLRIGRQYNTSGFEGRVYSFRMFTTADDASVIDAYPALVAGLPCLYDTVKGKVHVAAAGTITAGPVAAELVDTVCEPAIAVPGVDTAQKGDLAAGATFEASAPATHDFSSELRATCTGWKLYTWDEAAKGFVFDDTRENAQGTGNSFVYTHDGRRTKIAWQWALSDPTGGDGKWYVGEFGDDANDGRSWATARRTIQTAVDDAAEGSEVLVAPGTYFKGTATSTQNVGNNQTTIPVALMVAKAVTVRSMCGPSQTIIDVRGSGAYARRRTLEVTSADALVAGFSLRGAGHGGIKVAPMSIRQTAGVVSNCTFSTRSTRATTVYSLSGTAKAYDIEMEPMTYIRSTGNCEGDTLIQMAGTSEIDGLVITNQSYLANTPNYYVRLNGAVKLRNALIAGNTLGNAPKANWKPIVYADNAASVLENCTIADNFINGGDGALQIDGAKVTVTNCIVSGNSNTAANPNFHGAANLTRVFTTCSESLVTGERGNLGALPLFADTAHGDWTVKPISKCIDGGGAKRDDDPNLTRTDVAGNPRLVGAAVDMGAYEFQGGEDVELDCAFDQSATVSPAGESLAVMFSGYAVGTSENATYLWDFGDGTTSDEWPETTHLYETPGLFNATLTVTDGEKKKSYVVENAVKVIPATCYLREDGGAGVYPYDTWEKATSSIAAAVGVGPSEIVLTNGTYQTDESSLMLNWPVTVRSVEGPEKTILDSAPGVTSRNHRHFTINHKDASVHGLTLRGGYSNYGIDYPFAPCVDMSAGVLSNCWIKGQTQFSRSTVIRASGSAKVVDCDIDGRGVWCDNGTDGQGGVYLFGSALMDRCRVHGFNFAVGSDTRLMATVIMEGSAILRNSLVTGNTNGTSVATGNSGIIRMKGGSVQNCTIAGNKMGGYGAVFFMGKAGTVVNSIVYDNEALMDAEKTSFLAASAGPTVSYTCAADFAGAAAGVVDEATCTTANPKFSTEEGREYHLTNLSGACLDTALCEGDAYAWLLEPGAIDLDGNPRVDVHEKHGLPDLGCFEFVYSDQPDPLDATVDVLVSSGRAPLEVPVSATVVGGDGEPTCSWDFGDGTPAVSGVTATNHVYADHGIYSVTLTVTCGEEAKTITVTNAVTVVPQACYVSTEGSSVSPYATWETAATNLMDAVNLNPKTVLVTNGTYAVSGAGVAIATDLELRSVNGPAVTTIRHTASGGYRIVWLRHADAVVDGFTLKNGGWHDSSWDQPSFSVVASLEQGTLSHCVVTNINSGYRVPTIQLYGTAKMHDCVVDLGGNNDGDNGGGSYGTRSVVAGGSSLIDRCEIFNYRRTGSSGDAATTAFAAVRLMGKATMRNSLVHDYYVNKYTEGARHAGVLVLENATVENCTVTGCKANASGTGISISSTGAPTVRNCVAWGNESLSGGKNDVADAQNPDAPRISYSCASDLTEGVNHNLASDPKFRLGKRRPAYSLRQSSPCVDAAEPLEWMEGATDLIGRPRRLGLGVDMGCYEDLLGGLMIRVR